MRELRGSSRWIVVWSGRLEEKSIWIESFWNWRARENYIPFFSAVLYEVDRVRVTLLVASGSGKIHTTIVWIFKGDNIHWHIHTSEKPCARNVTLVDLVRRGC